MPQGSSAVRPTKKETNHVVNWKIVDWVPLTQGQGKELD